MAHHAPTEVCKDTENLDELLEMNAFVRQYLKENFPPLQNTHSAWRDLLPSDNFHHNQELKMLARTLMTELNEGSKGHALEELMKEFENRFRHVSPPAESEESIANYNKQVDEAWELVYHWHHTLLKSATARPTAEADLYAPALRREGQRGEIVNLLKCLGNPKTGPILFPTLYGEMSEKAKKRKLHKLISDDTQDIIAYSIEHIPEKGISDIEDHTPPPDGSLNYEQKVQLAFLATLATMLTPYFAPAVLLEVILEIKAGKPVMSTLYEGLISNNFLPKVPAHLSEDEQARMNSNRLNAVRAFAATLPVVGVLMLLKINS